MLHYIKHLYIIYVTRSVGLSRKSEILTFELITVSNNSDSKLYNDV